MANSNGSGPTCSVAGCTAKPHGRGLCRKHFDSRRYAETTGQGPEAQARQAREWAIEAELSFGPRGESVFADDEERRAAWEERKAEMMEQYLGPPYVGLRPWSWWQYVAQREHHLAPYPLHAEGSIAERADAIDQHEIEPVVFLASGGYLTDRELATIKARADEARPRLGTAAERVGSGGVDRVDRRAVKLADAVREARRG